MTYLLLSLAFLIPALILTGLAARRLKRHPSGGHPSGRHPAGRHPSGGHLRAGVATACVLIALTIVFDNLMIAAGLFSYENHLGIHLGYMPIEDLSYTIAAVTGLPSLWLLLGPRDATGQGTP